MTSTTVDPDIQTLLDALAAMGGVRLSDLGPEDARAMFKAMSTVTTGPEVAHVEDRTAPGEGGEIPLRVYRPPGDGPFGLLVWYHGGGFVIGDLDTADSTARELCARSGCVVVSVDYRLAPEHRYPAAAEDAWSALTWAIEHAEGLGADPARAAVGGDSAGGNLAAVTAVRARDEGVALRHQLLVYPVVDLAGEHPSRVENGEGYFLTKDAMDWFETCYLADHEPHDPAVSPLYADLARLAPAHVVTAGFDPLRDEGEAYAAALRTAGVEVLDDRYPTMIHGFLGMTTTTTVAGEALDRAAEQLRARIGATG